MGHVINTHHIPRHGSRTVSPWRKDSMFRWLLNLKPCIYHHTRQSLDNQLYPTIYNAILSNLLWLAIFYISKFNTNRRPRKHNQGTECKQRNFKKQTNWRCPYIDIFVNNTTLRKKLHSCTQHIISHFQVKIYKFIKAN